MIPDAHGLPGGTGVAGAGAAGAVVVVAVLIVMDWFNVPAGPPPMTMAWVEPPLVVTRVPGGITGYTLLLIELPMPVGASLGLVEMAKHSCW